MKCAIAHKSLCHSFASMVPHWLIWGRWGALLIQTNRSFSLNSPIKWRIILCILLFPTACMEHLSQMEKKMKLELVQVCGTLNCNQIFYFNSACDKCVYGAPLCKWNCCLFQWKGQLPKQKEVPPWNVSFYWSLWESTVCSFAYRCSGWGGGVPLMFCVISKPPSIDKCKVFYSIMLHTFLKSFLNILCYIKNSVHWLSMWGGSCTYAVSTICSTLSH